MGRSGGGGVRGGGFSHSSHSSSRSHSSHVGGSSFRPSSPSRPSSQRVGSGSFGSSGGGFRPSSPPGGGFRPTPPPPPPPRPGYGYRPRTTVHVHNSYGYGSGYGTRRRSGSSVGTVIAMVIILIALFMIIGVVAGSAGSSNVPQSTVNREPIKGGSFTTSCVIDEIGWIRDDGSSESKLGGKLEYFWKETGIQPYVVLLEHSAEYSSVDVRYDYADALYDQLTGGREDAILLVYFDDEPDGYWEMVKGKMAASVMDDEACEILWGFCDRYWYDLSYTVPQAIENTFDKTADSIMRKATTGWDVMNTVVIAIAVVMVIAGVVIIMKVRRKHEHERAEETEAILQAGQNQATFGSGGDDLSDLTDRYDNM